MNRYIYGCIFLFTSLQAQIAEDDLSGIYTEAAFFITVLAVLAVISYIFSTKHAKEYAIKNQANVEQERLNSIDEITKRKERLAELSKMFDDGLLRKDEFNVLKKWIYNDE